MVMVGYKIIQVYLYFLFAFILFIYFLFCFSLREIQFWNTNSFQRLL